MGLPDILKVHFFLIPMMYVLCLVGFCPGILDIWLTSYAARNREISTTRRLTLQSYKMASICPRGTKSDVYDCLTSAQMIELSGKSAKCHLPDDSNLLTGIILPI